MFKIILCALAVLLTSCHQGSRTFNNKFSDNEIRFYSVNNYTQQALVQLVKDTDLPGCHNFFRKTKVHRVSVIGFEGCTVYSEKNCPDAHVVEASWKAKKKNDANQQAPQQVLTEGSRWVVTNEGNIGLSSWKCSLKPE